MADISSVDAVVSSAADPLSAEEALAEPRGKRASLIPKQEKRGWLEKANKDGKYWKKRWFKLTGHTLQYFASEGGEGKAKGELVLTGRTVKRHKDAKHQYAFEITAITDGTKHNDKKRGGERSLFCAAEDEEEMLDWMETFYLAGANDPDAKEKMLHNAKLGEDAPIPWDKPSVNAGLAKYAEGGQCTDQEEMLAINALSGYDKAPFPPTESSNVAIDRLKSWIQGQNGTLVPHEITASQLKWQEFRSELPAERAPMMLVTVKLQNAVLGKLTLNVKSTATVLEVLLEIFKKASLKIGGPLFETGEADQVKAEGQSRYVLKVCGYNDYMLQKGAEMLSYTHVQFCQRERVPCEVRVVRMSDEELATLVAVHVIQKQLVESGSGAANTGKSGPEYPESKWGTAVWDKTVEFDEDLRENKSEKGDQGDQGDQGGNGTGAAAAGGGWQPPQRLEASEIRFPLRMRLLGLEGLVAPEVKDAMKQKEKDENYPVEQLVVRIALYHNGELLPPAEQEGQSGGGGLTAMPASNSVKSGGTKAEGAGNGAAKKESGVSASGGDGGGDGAEVADDEALQRHKRLVQAKAGGFLIETDMFPYSEWPGVGTQWLYSVGHRVCNLPPATRLALMVVAVTPWGEELDLAGISVPLFDVHGEMLSGEQELPLWPHPNLQVARMPHLLNKKSEEDPRPLNLPVGTPELNLTEDEDWQAGSLFVQFDSYPAPVVLPTVTLKQVESQVGETELQKGRKTEAMPEVEEGDENRDSTVSAADTTVGEGWGNGGPSSSLSPEDQAEMRRIGEQDPLYILTPSDRVLLWSQRNRLSHMAKSRKPEQDTWLSNLLPKMMAAVHWGDPRTAMEGRRLLVKWAPFSEPAQALELLDCRFSDPTVRSYAVRTLNRMSDAKLQEFMLQLVQVLKYECHHDSALSRFLLARALRCPVVVGFRFFWMLRSEMYSPEIFARYGALLRCYTTLCKAHRRNIAGMLIADGLLVAVAESILKVEGKSARKRECQRRMAEISPLFPSSFQLCLSSRLQVTSVASQHARVMESKKKPLLLFFNNADSLGDFIRVIFKTGDDLRQDLMTLQMLRIMDNMWLEIGTEGRKTDTGDAAPKLRSNVAREKSQRKSIFGGLPGAGAGGGGAGGNSGGGGGGGGGGLDLRMKPYGCCATGFETGMIELVLDSETINTINQEYGGTVVGAFNNSVINKFLDAHSRPGKERSDAQENFMRTCAGYCVATYVMGIGDRHSDNIMITRQGHLFHIDFGHFLGHFKEKFGIKRERAPFVFTPAMAAVMGGKGSETFVRFENMCCDAFNILRTHGSLFLNLFILVIPAGMPELRTSEDIKYLQDQLALMQSQEEARETFLTEIENSLKTRSRQFDDAIHSMVHS